MPKGQRTSPDTKAAIFNFLVANRKQVEEGKVPISRVALDFGVSIPVVQIQAARANVVVRQGRPVGAQDIQPRKKSGPRSPHRSRAIELKAQDPKMSLRKIANQITTEVRASAKTAEDRKFKISPEAIRQLLLQTDDTDDNEKINK